MTAASLLRETLWSMVSEAYERDRLRLPRLHPGLSPPLRRRLREPLRTCRIERRDCRPRPRSSSSAAASSAAPLPIIWRARLERRAADGARQAHRPARPGMRRGWWASSAPRPTSPSSWYTASRCTTGWRPRPARPRAGNATAACALPAMPSAWTEIKRQATTAHSFGLEMHLLTPARGSGPLAAHGCLRPRRRRLPADRRPGFNPADIAAGAGQGRAGGGCHASVEDCPVDGVPKSIEGRGLARRHVGQGEIACDIVVICAGQWARELGRLAGVSVPLQSVQHQYLVTEPIRRRPARAADAARSRSADLLQGGGGRPGDGRLRAESHALGAERHPRKLSTFTLLQPDQDHFEPIMDLALARVPALANAGIKQIHQRPGESFTPDGNFILGEAPGNAQAFSSAPASTLSASLARGGAGMALAEWIVDRRAALRSLARGYPALRGAIISIRGWVRPHARSLLASITPWPGPHEEYRAGRPLRVSPLYERLKAQGACFGAKLGWERPTGSRRPA